MTDERMDKSKWSPGPWHDEPDRVEFEHAGLRCLMLRSYSGTWLGYAGVFPGHPWYGVGYTGTPGDDVSVHGGLTFSEIGERFNSGYFTGRWVFGFDCNHDGDFSPDGENRGTCSLGTSTYCDVEFVRREVASLAEQLAAVGRSCEGDKRMTDNRIDFEDCGAFVRVGGMRFAKSHVSEWGPSGRYPGGELHSLYVVTPRSIAAQREPKYSDLQPIPDKYIFKCSNSAEVLAALDEAMRGAR